MTLNGVFGRRESRGKGIGGRLPSKSLLFNSSKLKEFEGGGRGMVSLILKRFKLIMLLL